MDVYECIRTRRTVREFKPDPVPEAIVQKILQAGRWAPSSSNTQPWHFVVVSARETIAALGRIATPSGRAARRHQGPAEDTRGDGTHHRHAVWVSA